MTFKGPLELKQFYEAMNGRRQQCWLTVSIGARGMLMLPCPHDAKPTPVSPRCPFHLHHFQEHGSVNEVVEQITPER